MPALWSFVEAFLLCLFLAAAVMQVVLAYRAGQVEAEEGLKRSRYRLPVALAVFGVVLALVVVGLLPSVPVSRPPIKPNKPTKTTKDEKPVKETAQVKALRGQLREVEKQITASPLGHERDRLKKEIAAAVKANRPKPQPEEAETEAPTEVEAGPSWMDVVRPVAKFLVPVVVLLGLGLLLYTGDLRALLPTRAAGGESDANSLALEGLNKLALAADQSRYRDGLEAADGINANLLGNFDRLDWAYLRSYCAVQLSAEKETGGEEKRRLLGEVERALVGLLEEAPNRGEAAYLLALVHHLTDKPQAALDGFGRAETVLPAELGLPFKENKSVCLLSLAEARLAQGNTEGAGELFDQVTALKALVEQVPVALVKSRLLNVRRGLQEGRLEDASRGVATVRQLEGLGEALKRDVAAMCDALDVLICVRGGDDAKIAQQLAAFLEAHLPPDLPEPDDGLAEEYLDSPIEGMTLGLPAQMYRSFFFLQAEAAARQVARQGRQPLPADVATITGPLLRALQFELRQREVLAALGGLAYWFLPEKRRRAMGWLETALSLGSRSRVARRIHERAQHLEMENREALEWFRTMASRFLHDPTVSMQVRNALMEELGRFQGAQPMLLGLEFFADTSPREPTLSLVKERAEYLEKLVADFAARKADGPGPEFDQLRKEYAGLVGALQSSLGRMTEVERRLVQAIGNTIMT
jgi:hypothetical protein